MTNLKKIWINTVIDKTELRIDWDNDRHQSIMFTGTDPEGVKKGLIHAAHLLEQEIAGGNI